jgi:hypothetical protein
MAVIWCPAMAADVFEPEDFSNLTHCQSLAWRSPINGEPPCRRWMTAREPRRRPPPQGWLGCIGIAGWFASDYADWATTWAFGVVLVLTPNAPDPEHLEEVTKETLSMGSPRLRAVSRPDGSWSTLEGSHRLAAAVSLGKLVEFVPVALDEHLQEGEVWDDVTFEPLLMPARDYFLRPAGFASSTRPDRLPGVWG